MKPYFGTQHEVILLTCAGTGALEAAVVNTLSPGDRVLAVTMGSFGDRFAKIAEVYGAAVTRLEVEWGQAPQPAAVRAAAAEIAGPQGGPADPQRDLDRRHERHPGARRRGPRGRPGRADPRRRDLRAGRRAVRHGRLGPGPRRHRVAEGVDGRAGHGDGGRRAARLGRRRDRDGCPASTSTSSATATTAVAGETPWTPAVAVLYQVDEGLRLMQAEGDGVYRAPRGVRGDDAGRPPGARLRAPRRRRRRVEDGHRGVDPRRASTGRRSTARSSATGSCSRAARASSRARSSGSATSAR